MGQSARAILQEYAERRAGASRQAPVQIAESVEAAFCAGAQRLFHRVRAVRDRRSRAKRCSHEHCLGDFVVLRGNSSRSHGGLVERRERFHSVQSFCVELLQLGEILHVVGGRSPLMCVLKGLRNAGLYPRIQCKAGRMRFRKSPGAKGPALAGRNVTSRRESRDAGRPAQSHGEPCVRRET